MAEVMLFLYVDLRKGTQNTVLHTVQTAILESYGGGAVLYGRSNAASAH